VRAINPWRKEEKRDRVSVFVRLSVAADLAIDERAIAMGEITRSKVVDAAVERFIKETLAHNPGFVKRPAGRETVIRKFWISLDAYRLLARAQQTHGYSYQDMLRHALGELTGVY
jgi:hypothetical protein